MFTLTDRLEDEIEIEGEIYKLNLSFDTVLLFFDLMDDDAFHDAEKIEIAFHMFVDTEKDFDFETKYKAVETIVETFIRESTDEQTSRKSNNGPSEQLYDLKQDAEYIYASFLQEYGLDLIDQQGKLRWEKFKALLVGLRDKTHFKEIVGIRAAELPTGKHMQEERKRLIKLKEAYKLKETQEMKTQKASMMFNKILNWAGGNKHGN